MGDPNVSEARDGVLLLDRLRAYLPAEPKPAGGLVEDWGPQAVWDCLVGLHYFKRIAPCVPLTFVPILRLCADDRGEVDAQYAALRAMHEPILLWDSPRERWRKFYGNMVREIEWVSCELKRYFNKGAYEELIVQVGAGYVEAVLTPALGFLDRLLCVGKDHAHLIGDRANEAIGRLVAAGFEKMINITGFLVGDVTLKAYDFRGGEMVMEVTDCLYLRAPRMTALPEEGCLLMCKGACERASTAYRSKMVFDPGLPETTCELRYRVDDDAPRRPPA